MSPDRGGRMIMSLCCHCFVCHQFCLGDPRPARYRPRGMPDATDFWQSRGALPKNLAAVAPGTTDSLDSRLRRKRLQDWTLQRAHKHLGERWETLVDLGCGYGDWTAQLAGCAARVRACDVSEGFCVEARRLIGETCRDVEVTAGDIRSFDPGPEVHLAHLGAVLMYLTDDDAHAVLAKLCSRMRPDGIVLGREWCAVGLGRRADQPIKERFSVHRTVKDQIALSTAAGFDVVETAPSYAIYAESVGGLAATMWHVRGWFWLRGSVSYVLRPRRRG